jgi:hypothetical protein
MAFAAVIAAAAEAPWRCLAPRVVGAMAMKQMTRDWRTGGFGVANDLPLACSLTFFVGHAGTASLLCCGCPCTSRGICCEGRCPALSGDARGMALEVAGGALPLLMVDLDEKENRVKLESRRRLTPANATADQLPSLPSAAGRHASGMSASTFGAKVDGNLLEASKLAADDAVRSGSDERQRRESER